MIIALVSNLLKSWDNDKRGGVSPLQKSLPNFKPSQLNYSRVLKGEGLVTFHASFDLSVDPRLS